MRSLQLPGLNEIRGLAALGVLVGHAGVGPEHMAANMVTVFFTLSGFLITYLLSREKSEKGTVSIRNFYIRRTLRIWPLYFAYLLIVVLFVPDPLGNLWYYVFFLGNFALAFEHTIRALAHYWSLAVEEQFYAFWPWLTRSRRSMSTWILAVLIGFELLRATIYLTQGPHSSWYRLVMTTAFHAMAIGGLTAVLFAGSYRHLGHVSHPLSKLFTWVCFAALLSNLVRIPSFIHGEAISVLSALIILQQVGVGGRAGWRSGILDRAGVISYGLYVYHPLVLRYLPELPGRETMLGTVLHVSLLVGATAVVAQVSYLLMERPCLNLKERFAVLGKPKAATN